MFEIMLASNQTREQVQRMENENKWYRVETKCDFIGEAFVDWYFAASQSDAISQAAKEADQIEFPEERSFSAREATASEAKAL